MAQTFLHRDQDIGVAPRFDEQDAIGMKAGQVKRRREQVAPMQAPQDHALRPRQDAGEEHRCGSVVGKLWAAGDFVERASGDATPGKHAVDGVEAERQHGMARAGALDLRDPRSQIFKDDRLAHGIGETRK